MGKNLIQQKRGKGSPTYRAPSFRYKGKEMFPSVRDDRNGRIEDIIHCQGHSAPLMIIAYPNEVSLEIAPEGVRVGDEVACGAAAAPKPGSIMKLEDIPEGTEIYNIEAKPGDGGRFARTSGAAARIISKIKDKVLVKLPSKKEREFSKDCFAAIGR